MANPTRPDPTHDLPPGPAHDPTPDPARDNTPDPTHDLPPGPRPGPTEECDLVMRGGITSGVVYPAAVRRLAARYRFRGIGGASAGAIAAALTAAAEHGRQTGAGTGFEQLDVIDAELVTPGLLAGLFRPHHRARELHAVGFGLLAGKGRLRAALSVLAAAPTALVVLVAWWVTLGLIWWPVGAGIDRPAAAGVALVAVWSAISVAVTCGLARRISVRTVVTGLLLPLLWPLALAGIGVGLHAWRVLSRPGFGLVPGSSTDGEALTDWLHRHLQAAAGRPDDQPLTFGALADTPGPGAAAGSVDLQLMTTDVSTARPVRLPDGLAGLAVDPDDLVGVLPAPVVAWLREHGTPVEGTARLLQLPEPADLPVLLGVRLSLSFPVLFTAVRLYARHPEAPGRPWVPCWFSDGGISSNFPVHLLDVWLPRRPTFTLSFAPLPLDAGGQVVPGETDVGIPAGPDGPRPARWVPIATPTALAGRILDTMQNWRDALQAELPGYRDRVYEARLDAAAGEGGLNLAMPPATIRRLQDRGGRVAEEIMAGFDLDQHRFTRYLLTMQHLERELVGPPPTRSLAAAFAALGPRLAAGDVGAGQLFGRTPRWLPAAGQATDELLTSVGNWHHFGGFAGSRPTPPGRLRIVSDG